MSHDSDRPGAVPFTEVVLLLLLVSGVVALVYQSLWTRQLSLILGSTTYAIGTVLAAFMAGLGAGAFVLGRRADAVARPLALYAALEVAIGLCGLASPVVLAQGNGLYAIFYAHLHDRPGLLTLARFAIGFLVVAVPAFLMGGTLPVATRHLVRQARSLGRSLGFLYALNTLGAALGVLALPFVLLPWLGMRMTLLACGAVNIAIGMVAWWIAAQSGPVPRAETSAGVAPAAAVQATPRGLLFGFFVSGFVALALESVWNRFFVMYFGSSIYSYAVILALYLTGIVLGGLWFTAFERRGADPGRVFAVCLALLIADLALTIPFMDHVLYVQLVVLDRLGLAFATFHLANVVAAVLVILPPTILFGISFPAVATAASRRLEHLGSDLGFVYLVNTAGTTAGALVTSFVLIPWRGVRGTMDVLGPVTLLALVCAAPAAWRTTRGRALGVLLAVIACLPALVPGWDLRLMHTPINKEPAAVLNFWHQGSLASVLETINVLELHDGVDATVSVADYGTAQRSLLVNGKADASRRDAFTQSALGHIPMLLRPDARDVLVVGFGSGTTLAAAAAHPAKSFDVVEISPDVLDLGDRYFRALNKDVLRDPRVTVHIEDGRNFIAFQPTRTYDVVISQPSNPWMTGVANLFTDDFFAAVRRRLRPGGVLGQWFQYYSMSPDDVRVLIGTVHDRFPNVYVFTFYDRLRSLGDLLMMASDVPLDFTPVLAALGEGGTLRQIGLSAPEDIAQGLVASPDMIERLIGGVPRNFDDRPRIELRAPHALFGSTEFMVLRSLLESSGGARLPATVALDGVEIAPESRLRAVSSGYRLAAMPSNTTLFMRGVRREYGLAPDGAGEPSLVLWRVTGALEQESLDLLADEALGAHAGHVGTVAVNGHVATVYRVPGQTRTVVAWSCPDTAAAFAVVDVAGGTAAPAVRCRHGG